MTSATGITHLTALTVSASLTAETIRASLLKCTGFNM